MPAPTRQVLFVGSMPSDLLRRDPSLASTLEGAGWTLDVIKVLITSPASVLTYQDREAVTAAPVVVLGDNVPDGIGLVVLYTRRAMGLPTLVTRSDHPRAIGHPDQAFVCIRIPGTGDVEVCDTPRELAEAIRAACHVQTVGDAVLPIGPQGRFAFGVDVAAPARAPWVDPTWPATAAQQCVAVRGLARLPMERQCWRVADPQQLIELPSGLVVGLKRILRETPTALLADVCRSPAVLEAWRKVLRPAVMYVEPYRTDTVRDLVAIAYLRDRGVSTLVGLNEALQGPFDRVFSVGNAHDIAARRDRTLRECPERNDEAMRALYREATGVTALQKPSELGRWILEQGRPPMPDPFVPGPETAWAPSASMLWAAARYRTAIEACHLAQARWGAQIWRTSLMREVVADVVKSHPPTTAEEVATWARAIGGTTSPLLLTAVFRGIGGWGVVPPSVAIALVERAHDIKLPTIPNWGDEAQRKHVATLLAAWIPPAEGLPEVIAREIATQSTALQPPRGARAR